MGTVSDLPWLACNEGSSGFCQSSHRSCCHEMCACLAGGGSSRSGVSHVPAACSARGQLEGDLPNSDSQAANLSALGMVEALGSQPSAPRPLPPGQGGPPCLASLPPIILRNTPPIASFLHPGGALQLKGKGKLNSVQREGMLSLGKWKVEPS